jgi:malate dehydrogenase (oxaloacetate-decarboxylating)(NADP+)
LGHVMVQFEDFGNTNAFRLLQTYKKTSCCFNDDIEGTAAITLTTVLAALRGTGMQLADQRIMFLGAGEAGTGIGQLIAHSLHKRSGMSMQDALKHCTYVDSKGLVCASRTHELQHHKLPFAHDLPFCPDLKTAMKLVRPTVLIGVSAVPGSFDKEVMDLMCEFNERPIILPLSNPTSKAECTFEEAYKWSNGKVIFASGSPFDPITLADGSLISPAQANNAYVFPAIGHAASLAKWTSIPDDAFLLCAETLADMTTTEDLKAGRLFPPFSKIMEVSTEVMAHVMWKLPELSQLPNAQNMTKQQWKQLAISHLWRPAEKPSTSSKL